MSAAGRGELNFGVVPRIPLGVVAWSEARVIAIGGFRWSFSDSGHSVNDWNSISDTD